MVEVLFENKMNRRLHAGAFKQMVEIRKVTFKTQ